MTYIIDRLPGSDRIVESMQLSEDTIARYENARIVFSYAREDWRFVEKVAAALRTYFRDPKAFAVDNGSKTRHLANAFCYTAGGKPFAWVVRDEERESEETFNRRNEVAAVACYGQLLQAANVFVLFMCEERIKAGPIHAPGMGEWQTGELHLWNQLNRPEQDETEYRIDFQNARDELQERDRGADRRGGDMWRKAQPSRIESSTQNSSIAISVDAYDLHSARLTAERILRHLLFRQSPSVPPPRDTVFSYEKDIVQMYHQIPRIIESWRAKPSDSSARASLLKLFAYIKKGIPPFWPCVSRQPDFIQAKENLLVDREDSGSDRSFVTIGRHRKGLDVLWPVDCPEGKQDHPAEPPDLVVAAALSKYHCQPQPCMIQEREDSPEAGPRTCMITEGLALPEAGPRKNIYRTLPGKVAIVVSGGIAPGINAVIDGIVHRQKQYSSDTEVIGVHHGFFGLKDMFDGFVTRLHPEETSKLTTRGGSSLMTCRMSSLLPESPQRDECVKKLVDALSRDKNPIKILYVIGGDGTMRAANHLAQACRQHPKSRNISIVGIPKTMDNDILWVWQSFGFATAVEKAREIIEHLATEVEANPRICVLQLFGSASGFVVSHAVLASSAGRCDFALIPEAEFSIDTLAWKLAVKIVKNNQTIPSGLVVMAESAIPSAADCKTYRDAPNVALTEKEKEALDAFLLYRLSHHDRFPDGQVTSELRSAGLKLVSEGLRQRLFEIFTDTDSKERLRRECNVFQLPSVLVDDEERFRVFTNEPRHLLRSVPPSFSDVIMGNRLGALAVDNAMAGYTGFMISQWLTEYVMVPLDLVALGRKHIPQDGIFWKSVLAKTGQGQLA